MDPRAWLAHLEQFGIKLGLDTIGRLADSLGRPDRACPVLHIAGTNGKGSVAAMTARALQAAGHRTGLYTSPHLIRLEERFLIDGVAIPAPALDQALTEVRDAVARVTSAGALDTLPTYFEATTAAAFLVFRDAGVDAAVIEVGLGGRFDATNIVTPLATAITSIDLDHQAQLGDSLAAIAAEKAGTIKDGVPVVVGRLAGEAREVVDRVAAAHGAPVVDAHAGTRVDARSNRGRYRVAIETSAGRYGPLDLALAGRHQVDNAVVAVRLLETAAARGLGVGQAAIEAGLSGARWPARLQMVTTAGGRVLVDGAHNPAGARALASYLGEAFPGGLPIVFGAMRDKDVAQMVLPLAPFARPLVATRAPGARAAEAADIAAAALAAAPRLPVIVEADLGLALDRAWHEAPEIAVAGSLHLAGAVLARLGEPAS